MTDNRNDPGAERDPFETLREDPFEDVPRVTDAERREADLGAFIARGRAIERASAEFLGRWDDEPTDDDYTEDAPDGIIYSHTVPCGMCGEIHPC